MIPLSPKTRIYLACGTTDMRKGFDGLAVLVQQVLEKSPHSVSMPDVFSPEVPNENSPV